MGVVGSLQQGPTAAKPTYRLIQILRAIAALMVVAHHATIMLWQRDHLPSPNWIAGSSGVDIFFVISGFVMTISSEPLRYAAHPARTFLARRLERIVPLYWIVTAAKVVVLLLAPALALNALGDRWHILSSFLFFPSLSAEARLEPVVVVGWTLNFEMAFYALFSLALAFRKRPVYLLAPVLLLLPLTPRVWLWESKMPFASYFYFNSVLWEFLMGMALGVAATRIRKVPSWIAWLLLPLGFVPLLVWNEVGVSYWRGALWGLPAMLVVFSAIALEDRLGSYSPRWALELGDASYSIYLIHTFTLPALGVWILRWPALWGAHWPAEILLAVFVLVVLSALSGEAVYRAIERPLMQWFKGRRRTAIPANA